MRLLIVTAGSRGDVSPFVALGARLSASGHEVRIFGPPDARSLVEERGLWFEPMGLAAHRAFEAVESSPLRSTRLLSEMWRESTRLQFAALIPHVGWPELVLSAGLTPGADAVAEKAGVPHRVAVFSPVFLPSAHHAPVPFTSARFPRAGNRLLWRFLAMSTNGMARRICNEHRRSFGLSPIPDVNDILFPRGRVLLAADPELSPAPRDWADALVQTGAWTPADGEPLPEEIESFLRSDAPFVYFGFGSVPGGSPPGLSSMLARVAASSGIGILHATPRPSSSRTSLYLPIGTTSHPRLFSRMDGVVHHGGAGTAAVAVRAGVPQWIVPHVLDQPYQARQVHLAGLGPEPTPVKRLHEELLRRRIQSLVFEPGYRARAHALRARVERRDPLADAEQALLAALARGRQ